MRTTLLATVVVAVLNVNSVFAASDVELLKQQLGVLKSNYEQRIVALEKRLEQAENKAVQASDKVQVVENKMVQQEKKVASFSTKSNFNPDISLILDGRFASFDNEADDYELPGFALGGEAGLGEEGFSLGHTELVMSATIDNLFFGKATIVLDDHDGEIELELEEAYIQTLGLGHGVTVKAGRFASNLGYLNEQHEHAWDFADAPLIYRGLFGNRLYDDGVQISYVAPTDLFIEVGAEAFRGSRFPAGGEQADVGAWTAYANVGGDIGIEHSWQMGVGHWRADDIEDRTSGGYSHGGGADEIPSFAGDSHINAFDVVYKWAPNGNPKNRNFKFQFEYFEREEDGVVALLNSAPLEETSYDGDQSGWYAQGVYQFKPQWRMGVRYDELDSSNSGSDFDVLGEAGLDNEGHTPKRFSAMLEWVPSEFSRIRLQYNHDESYEDTGDQLFIQYTHSLGSHGAHAF